MIFKFVAINNDGTTLSGSIESESIDSATSSLKSSNIVVKSISEIDSPEVTLKKSVKSTEKLFSMIQITIFVIISLLCLIFVLTVVNFYLSDVSHKQILKFIEEHKNVK